MRSFVPSMVSVEERQPKRLTTKSVHHARVNIESVSQRPTSPQIGVVLEAFDAISETMSIGDFYATRLQILNATNNELAGFARQLGISEKAFARGNTTCRKVTAD